MFRNRYFGARHWAAKFFGVVDALPPSSLPAPRSGGYNGGMPYKVKEENLPDFVAADNEFFLIFQ